MKEKVMMYLSYIWYVLKHKWFVMIECFKMGLYFRGIIHDLSKFYPVEFIAYSKHFCGNINKGRDKTGNYNPFENSSEEFKRAWLHHAHHNDHHWQYWFLETCNEEIVYPMNEDCIKEMLCDWVGAGKAQNNIMPIKDWYLVNMWNMKFHPETRGYIEDFLGITEEYPLLKEFQSLSGKTSND